MKTKYFSIPFLIVALLCSFAIHAQNGNSTFEIFSENGDPFILVMNGIQQNTQAQTNVKAQNMAMSAYKIRVIFKDPELGALNDQINLEYASHQTYAIKQKKISNLQKNLKSVSNNVALELALKTEGEAAAKQAQIENENSRFVIRMISKVPSMAEPAPANQYTQAAPAPTNKTTTQVSTTNSVPSQQTTVVQQSTTKNGNNTNVNTNKGTNVSMNINLNGNLNTSTSHTETSTTTVHTSGGAPVPAQQSNVYVLPGYNGPTGCSWPMSESDFANARNSIQSKSFEDTKLTVAKQIFNQNCLLSSQVRDIMSTFDFEATKLEFAKYAYGRTYDIGNYYQVNDVFDFEASISDLNAYINSYRR